MARKILYQGDSSGLFQYDAFIQFMDNKGRRITYENEPLQRMDLYETGPATVLIYLARKRIIPRGMDLWGVTVSVHGSDIEGMEKLIADGMQRFRK